MAETSTIMKRVSYIVGMPLVVEIAGISWRIPIKRKYTFATFWNCSKRFFGIKFHTV